MVAIDFNSKFFVHHGKISFANPFISSNIKSRLDFLLKSILNQIRNAFALYNTTFLNQLK